MRKSINEIFHIEMDYIANTRTNPFLLFFFQKNNSALSGYTESDDERPFPPKAHAVRGRV
jgi:hypothetical protein